MKHTPSLIAALFGALTVTAPVQASEFDNVAQVTMRSGWREADGRHIAGLQIDLAAGWKTYWRQPGDVGIPPRFQWENSRDISDVQIVWPAPSVTRQSGMRTIGYDTQVVLPVVITPNRSGPIDLNGTVEIGVCAEMCIPMQFDVALTLPGQGAPDQGIAKSLNNQAKLGNRRAKCTVTPTQDSVILTVTISAPALARAEDVVIEIPGTKYWVKEPKTQRQGNQLIAKTEVVAIDGKPMALARNGILTTVIGGGKATEYLGCHAP